MAIRSLEGRLQLGVAAGLALLLAALWYLAHEALHRVADEFVVSRLQHDAEALVAAVQRDARGNLVLGQKPLTPVYHQPYSGHYFALRTEDGAHIQSRSLWDQHLEARLQDVGDYSHWYEPGPAGQRLMVWGGSYRKEGLKFTLIVAEDIAPLSRALRQYDWILAGVALGGWLLVAFLLHRLVHDTFNQLRPVYADIERLENGESVFLTEQVPGEVLPLVRKLNHLLASYQQRLVRSRHAAGNLAHALKGPLNLMLLGLEHADLDRDTRAALVQRLEHIRNLSERELKRARLAGPAQPGKKFRPAEELPVLIHLLHSMHGTKRLDIQCRVDIDGDLNTDREDLLELFGNLLDNASKWARGRVLCRLYRQPGSVVIQVEDDGPGCDEEQLRAISERGVRLDEEVSGHGLGLSIAKDIVDLYGGRIRFGRSETLGGFRSRVELPGL